jgi:hypothetical protein
MKKDETGLKSLPAVKEKKTGAQLILEEREHQIQDLHFSNEHDDQLNKGQLLFLAQYCLFSNNDNVPKEGWSTDYLKQIHLKTRIEQLTIAGAVIAAEIDRRLRIQVGLTPEEEKELTMLTEMRTNPDVFITQEEFEHWHELRKKKYGEY